MNEQVHEEETIPGIFPDGELIRPAGRDDVNDRREKGGSNVLNVVQNPDETMASKTLDKPSPSEGYIKQFKGPKKSRGRRDSFKKISGQRDITSFLRGGLSRRRSRSEAQDEGQSDMNECALNLGQIAKNTGESGGRENVPE